MKYNDEELKEAQARLSKACESKRIAINRTYPRYACKMEATQDINGLNLCAYHAAMLRPWATIEHKPEPQHYATEFERDLCRIIYHTDLSFSEKIRKVDELNKFYTFVE